jgi:hypothetical protein
VPKVSYQASGYCEQLVDMDESNVRGTPRFTIFLAVVVVHLAVLAWLTTQSRIGIPSAATDTAVEVMFFPPTKPPKVRFESARLQRVNADTAITATLPGLTAPSLSPPSSGTDGNGAPVNWAAEARRAVQAVEIRRNHPPNVAISSSPWSDWWPREHHAGERYKTESGDWIVWISSSCYQIARAGPGALGSTPPQTVCPLQPDKSRSDERPSASKMPTQ